MVASAVVGSATENVIVNPGAGSPNRLVFSRGSVPPPPGSYPNAPEIIGPTSVQPWSNCMWTVNHGAAVQPATYRWYVDGVLQPETTELFRYSPSTASFNIEIFITDANGQNWANQLYVDVSYGAPTCTDM